MFNFKSGRKTKSTLASRLKKAETRLKKKQKVAAMKSRLATIQKQLSR